VADRGSETASLLRAFVRETAVASLDNRGPRQVLPIYVDLAAYPTTPASGLGRLHALLLASLQPFWPDLMNESQFHDRLSDQRSVFRIVLDNGDDLSSTIRDEILREAQQLAADFPAHEYFFAMDPRCWNLDDLEITKLVVMQPLRRHKVESFLRGRTGELRAPMARLADRLSSAGLYDLASRPWLLVRMARDAARGTLPKGRAQVLSSLLEDGIQRIPVERGQQSRSRESLYALALRMQLSYRNSLPAREAFETLAEVRDNREYNLEEVLTCLIGEDLLEQTPDGAIRFPFPFVQSFCSAGALSAKENRGRLDQVTAGLGRPRYLKWWEEALILLSGMLEEADRESLVQRIAYGSTLTEGDHLFLAARCLHESGLAAKQRPVADQILDALVWRSDAENERHTPRRAAAVRALGDLFRPDVLPRLTAIARQRVRRAWDGETVLEYGAVRQAAVRALYRTPDIWEKIQDAPMTDVLRAWQAEDVAKLRQTLCSPPVTAPEQASLAGAAAFALGDLQFDPAARDALYESFASPATDLDTRWSIADALLALDPEEVAERVIRPGMARDGAELLLYLITQLRLPHAWALEYVESFLGNPDATAGCKGRALLALGMLNAQNWRERLVETALGEFASIHALQDDREANYLRQKALEALAEIGTMEQLDRLRAARPKAQWTAQLSRSFYDASERISYRGQSFA
jgi:hypothetical protein